MDGDEAHALRVDQAGPASTVQDHGRPGHRGFGVPSAGAFDRASHDLANALLGNDPSCATIEMTLWGGSFTAARPIAIALAGAPMPGQVRSERGDEILDLSIHGTASLRPGDRLILGGAAVGARTYLAVLGGWQTPTVLGSRSSETRLAPGDWLAADAGSTTRRRTVANFPTWDDDGPIRVIDGPDGDASLLEAGPYLVTDRSSRMGLFLEGPPIDRRAEADRASSPVAPGAVQVTGGQPIVLGVAGGTMGGYLHLAHVIHADLDRLAQARPGRSLRFRRVEVEEAREVDRARRRALAAWFAVLRAHARAD